MIQIMTFNCAEGGISMATYTVMRYGGMDCADKARILRDTNTN